MIKEYSMKTQANSKLTKNFTVKEFACNDGSDLVLIDSELVDILQKIRDHVKKPVHINSAYRTPSYNKKIGGASKSQHLEGKAADIRIDGETPERVAEIAEYYGADGIGLYNTFTHIDTRGITARWDFRK